MLWISYMPSIWKHVEIIVIHKSGKPPRKSIFISPNQSSSSFRQTLIKKIIKICEDNKIIPDFQFGFKAKHSTIHQLHRVVDHISSVLETKTLCLEIFLGIARASWTFIQIKTLLPINQILFSQRTFVTKINVIYSNFQIASAGVP